MTLTYNNSRSMLDLLLKKTEAGIGSPYSQGTEAMCRQVCGFFFALTIMVGGVVGSRKACRILDPVYQPVTSSTARRLIAPVGGIKTTVKENHDV